LAPSGIGRVSWGSLVGAAEQPTNTRLVAIKTLTNTKLLEHRRISALIWRRRRSVNQMAVDDTRTHLLMVGSSVE
jgi:hypothetical protein